MANRETETLDGVEELVRAYAELISAGKPPVLDDTPLADNVYAEDRTDDGRLRLMLAGGGPTVYLVYDEATGTAELVMIGSGETIRRSDTEKKSLATFAAAYAAK